MKFNLLVINLTQKSHFKKEVEEDLLKTFLGGRGLGVRLFFDFVDESYFKNSQHSESPIFFLTGPLTGSLAPLSGRFHSVFHSPLTNTIFDSSCGGKTGIYLKSNGFDGVAIVGASKEPVFIVIDENEVRFNNADRLTGKLISDKEKILKDEVSANISTIISGAAAEKGVLFANVVSDRRFFGRGGLGFLFGKKNLHAIVVKKGNKTSPPPSNPEQFSYTLEEIKKWIHGNPITSQGLPEFGTSVLMNLINELKILPHKNFLENHFSFADCISGETLKSKVIRRKACYGCMVGCGRVTEKGEGPEFETLWALGANLGIKSIDFIIEMNELCSQYGVDTITLGGTLASYLEIKGLPFGDEDLIKELILQTVSNENEGALIALGSKRLCKELGKEDVSMSVKSLEMPAYHPAGVYGMGLAYGTSNRGACHLRSYMIAPEVLGIPKLIDPKIKVGKAGLVIYFQNSHAVADSAIFCRFLSLAVTDEYLSRVVSAYTGFDYSTTDYQKIGERIYVLERVFNLKMGFSSIDDLLPQRVVFDGYSDMLKEYYVARGYDCDGVPTPEKLKNLGLDKICQGLIDVSRVC